MPVNKRKTVFPNATIPSFSVEPIPSHDEIWTVKDVAAFLKLSDADSVYELTRKRSKTPLPARRVGKQIRFSKNQVLVWFYGTTA